MYLVCTLDRFDKLREDLANYSTAIRDYKYWMDTCKEPLINEISKATGHGIDLAAMEMETAWHDADQPLQLDRAVFTKDELNQGWKWIVDRFLAIPRVDSGMPRNTQLHQAMLVRSLDLKEAKAFVSRLSIALFGGLALVGPMLIMTLHPTRLTPIVTTSVCVVALAVILAWRLKDAQSKDIVGITAAYAAVLVVFVGANGGSTNSG